MISQACVKNSVHRGQNRQTPPLPDRLGQGGHGTGKTGNLILTFSRQAKHREFCCDTGKIFETQGKYFILAQGEI